MAKQLNHTPLHKCHVELKAKMVDFGGWHMPLSYGKVVDEHKTVRSQCGIFDVSHMGELFISGSESTSLLQFVLTNDVNALSVGQGQYTAMCNQAGGVIDDLICYRLEDQRYLLCVNASNVQKDFDWIKEHSTRFDVDVDNASRLWAQIAVQGPESKRAISAILSSDFEPAFSSLKYMEIRGAEINSTPCYIARTGYTGEQGYEIYMPNDVADGIWRSLLEKGCSPVGLGARDTLRTEACYLLYGNDMNDSVSPLEAGISWAVKVGKGDFIGREALITQKEQGISRRLGAFTMEEPGIPRHGMEVRCENRVVGHVTSGSVLPSLGKNGGMCLVDSSCSVGSSVEIDIRGKLKKAAIVKKPLYSAKVKD